MLDPAELIAFVAETGGRPRLQLTGRSMRPLLRRGMLVELEPLHGPPRRGDILVYRTPRGLVAHRLLRLRPGAFVICGDAHPDRLEFVAPKSVLGRVSAVWSNGNPQARRLDGPLFRTLGLALVATRPLRSLYVSVAGRLAQALAEPAAIAPAPAFRALVAATRAFEAGAHAAGVAALAAVPAPDLIAVVKRHHAGGLVARWLERAQAAGVALPAGLLDSFVRIRWTTALQADRVLERARDAAGRLAAGGVSAIVLKGGARLAAGEPEADLQFSGDLDLLVPDTEAERAVAVLRAAGYAERLSPERVAFYAAHLHQRAPLYPPGGGVPVEIHRSLSIPGSVSQSLTYAELAPFTRVVRGPAGEVRVLDDVAAALHIAYHGRDFRVWRDIVLLARKFRLFSPLERERFDAFVAGERRDGVRLRSAVAAADVLAERETLPGGDVARYVSWAIGREDLPELFRRRAHIVEALVARCGPNYVGVAGALRQVRGWLYNALLLPSLLRFVRWSDRTRGAGAAALRDILLAPQSPGVQARSERPKAAQAAAASTHRKAVP